MPEVAEVRLIADNIKLFLKGKNIKYIELRDRSLTQNWAKRGAKGLEIIQKEFPLLVNEVKTKGKFCWIELENGWKIMIQFGMSGNVRKEPTDEYLKIFNANQKKPITKEEYLKHCHLKVTYYEKGTDENTIKTIYYHDIRRFGSWTFTKDSNLFNKKLNKLGHDPLGEDQLQENEVIKRFRQHNYQNICKVLMNQEGPLAGVGNYLKSESIYQAKIYPLADIKNIPDNSLIDLYKTVREIAKAAYDAGGATLYTYTGMNGDQTEFKNTLKIYKRSKDPQGHKVHNISEKESPDRRSTFWVPEVQTIGKVTPIQITPKKIIIHRKTPHPALIKITKIKNKNLFHPPKISTTDI